jgi:predicted ATPase/class 3 adenylate cyclase
LPDDGIHIEAGEDDCVDVSTLTFVFTDIEGSTRRWEREPAAMQTALQRHDALMRAAIGAHRGHVFKTIGDAFCAAFADPHDAIAATLSAQRALAAEDFSAVNGLHVRAAVCTGTAECRDGDYFGPTLNRVARLMAIGHGGQVLVSAATAGHVESALPPSAKLRDLGEHRLRDLAQPEYVYQLVAPGLAAEFPALRSLDPRRNNLPVQVKSFVGREREISQIAELIDAHRLVTLVGPGGVGKTRTSLHVAAHLLDVSVDGVWLVELAPLSSGDYVASTVAEALGLALPAEGDSLGHLVEALKERKALLVFDNCEHVVDESARVIAAILRTCPRVKVLASSRQSLGIDGEEIFKMPSLETPRDDGTGRLSVAEAMDSAAVGLFVDRARSIERRFSLTDDNAPIVADICRRLDGIPLAIELAAARVQVLNPQQLRVRLDERFRLLTGGSRDALPRQQTLRATIDWSYDLLEQPERELFRRLGIFVNGFTLEGAEAVAAGEDAGVFDGVASLVAKSLVLAEPDGESLRYRFLESTRAYALERLADAGERDLAAGRHLQYLRDRFAGLWARREHAGGETELTMAVQAELEDVRFALDDAMVRSDVIAAAELLADIYVAWTAVGLNAEGVARIERYLARLPSSEARLQAHLSTALSFLIAESGQKLHALETARGAVERARESGEAETLVRALLYRSRLATKAGSLSEAEEALTEAESIPDKSPYMELIALEARAALCFFSGDREGAVPAFERLRREYRSLGNPRLEIMSAMNLAEVEYALGRTQRAIAIVNEIVPVARSSADPGMLTYALYNLTGYLIDAGDLPGAIEAARETIDIRLKREPNHPEIAIAIEHIALVFALRGDPQRAAVLEGYAQATFARAGFEREVTEAMTYDRLTALLQEHLGADEAASLAAKGASLAPNAAVALALDESAL